MLAATLFGLNGSVSKVAISAGLNSVQVTLLRVLSAAFLSGACLVVAGRGHFAVTFRELAALAPLGVGGLALVQWLYCSGSTAVALLQWLYSAAISLLPIGVAPLFEYTAVILVALAAWLVFGERIAARLWWAMGAVVVGLAVVPQLWKSALRPLGILAALGAGLAFPFYFLGPRDRCT